MRQMIHDKIKKYSWVDIGSSFLPSSLQAAFLYNQLQSGFKINKKRKDVFFKYHEFFSQIVKYYNVKIPYINDQNKVNGHFYWILVPEKSRSMFIKKAKLNNIELTTHFEPLHNSKAGKKYGKTYEDLKITRSLSKQIVRIPIHTQMNKFELMFMIKALEKTIYDCIENKN